MCGSTAWSTNAPAAHASKALPPFSSITIPEVMASQCWDVTTPNVPRISGRVVNILYPLSNRSQSMHCGLFQR